MKNAKQIRTTVAEALAAGQTVYLTDGTVTRKIVQVEASNWGSRDTLDVLIIDGDGNKIWEQIQIEWPWDDLDGYGLTKLNGDLYIAPDWWIAI